MDVLVALISGNSRLLSPDDSEDALVKSTDSKIKRPLEAETVKDVADVRSIYMPS